MSYVRSARRAPLGSLNTGPMFPTTPAVPGGLGLQNFTNNSNQFSWGSVSTGVQDVQGFLSTIKSIQNIAAGFKGATFSSKSTDAQRQARVDFFHQSGLLNSVTAARYVIGGTLNTASHEIPMWQAAADDLKARVPDVWAAATAAGAKWASNIPDPGGTQSMVDDVDKDLTALGQNPPLAQSFGGSSSSPSGGTTGSTTGKPAVALPAMHSTAPFNWTPYLIAGGIGLIAINAMRKS